MEFWNERLLARNAWKRASKNDSQRNAGQQKIGDYWAACMDEAGIEASGLKPIQPELDRIAALKSKKDITLEIAHLHHMFPRSMAVWGQPDRHTLLRLHRTVDYDNASMVVGQIDQAGLSLPNRDYYLKSDDKSKELLTNTARILRKCWCWLANRKHRLHPMPAS